MGTRYVEFYRTVDDDSRPQEVAGRAELHGEKLVFIPEGLFSTAMINMFRTRGIHDATGELVTIAQPEAFLDALRYEFSGIAFRASAVKEQ